MGCNCNNKPRNHPVMPQPKQPVEAYGVVSAIKDTVTGNAQFASDDKQTERKAICVQCESYRKLLNQCALCGCIVHFKVKFEQSVCPAGKW